jgi:hypothetical protein
MGYCLWFEGVNGFLDGKKPKDLLVTASEAVSKAAGLEMQGIAHG